MTSVLSAATESLVAVRAGWTLVLVLWATTVIALVLAGWRTLRPQVQSAQQHHAAALALALCIVALIAAPTLLVKVEGFRPALPLSSSSHTPVHVEAPVSRPDTTPPSDLVFLGSFVTILNRTAGAVGVIWLVGAAALLVRLLGGWFMAQLVSRRATPVEEQAALEALQRVQQHFGVTVTVSLRHSNDIEAPVVLGARHPTLLLPSDLTAQVSEEALPSLLAHECAHIARHDYAVNIGQSVVDALLFFSPAARWVSQRLREAREFCCDDAAIRFASEDRAQYVRVLSTLASLGSQTQGRAVLGSAGPRLITRVRRLLSVGGVARPSWPRTAAVMLAMIVVGTSGPPMLRLSASQLAALPAHEGTQVDWPLPIGYALRQPGSSVTLQVESGADYLAQTVTLRNVADVAVTSVTLAAIVENNQSPPPRITKILTSNAIPVAVAPGSVQSVSAQFVSRLEIARLGGESAPQVFFGVSRVVFANGAEWSIQPNPTARSHQEALGLTPYSIPRALVSAVPSTDTSKTLCLDDAGGGTSQGGIVEVRDEPGRFVQCVNGSWVNYSPALNAVPSGVQDQGVPLDLALNQHDAPAALRGYTANAGTFLYESATVMNVSPQAIKTVTFGVLLADPEASSRSLLRRGPVTVDLGPGDIKVVKVGLLTPEELTSFRRKSQAIPKVTLGLLGVTWDDGSSWNREPAPNAVGLY